MKKIGIIIRGRVRRKLPFRTATKMEEPAGDLMNEDQSIMEAYN